MNRARAMRPQGQRRLLWLAVLTYVVAPGCFQGGVADNGASETGTETGSGTETDTDAEPFCGDGIVQSNWETCDDGNDSNTDACVNCQPAECGDSWVQEGVEVCDDGNTNEADDCSNMCTSTNCGDGVVQPLEQCDDANTIDEDECTNLCQLPICGDGVVSPTNGEECDDDANEDGDGCTYDCHDEWKLIFVTSTGYGGDLGGHEGADAKCAARAQAAGLVGEYRAWISTSESSAADYLVHHDIPYYNTAGERLASDWNDLVDGELDAKPRYDESGALRELNGFGECLVWTGTENDGSAAPAPETCMDWGQANSLNDGHTGDCVIVTGWTTDGYTAPCDTPLSLYCVKQ